MQYDVITFDTQTVETNSFHFDGGLLAQLKQFKAGPVRVVLSEIVVREIIKHLVAKTRTARDRISSAHKEAVDHGLVAADAPFLPADLDWRAIARQRVTRFFQEIGAEIVRVTNVRTSDVMEAYFQPAPPFSATGKNKAEFPDAIALMSLERWAKEKNLKMMAVSNDKGWQAFGELSAQIDVHAELKDALALLQKHAEEATSIAQTLLATIDTKSDARLATKFTELFADEVSGYGVSAEAESSYSVDADDATLTLIDYKFAGDPEDLSFAVTQSGPNILVVQIDLEAKIEAYATFYLSIYDSIDKDYTPVGSTHHQLEQEIEFGVLATFERSDPAKVFKLAKVEIVHGPSTIDFGFVEPNYEPGPEDQFEMPDFDPDDEGKASPFSEEKP